MSTLPRRAQLPVWASVFSSAPPAGADVLADGVLQQRVGSGDAAAFRIVADALLGGIVRYGCRLLANQAEAEEVAQETFLRFWQTAARAPAPIALRAWLYRIAHNLCIDRLRRRHVAVAHSAEVETRALEVAPQTQPAALVEQKQLVERVQAALELLPERQRAAVLLAHYEELAHSEAALVLEVSVEAFESLLARARRSLRATLSAPPAREEIHAD